MSYDLLEQEALRFGGLLIIQLAAWKQSLIFPRALVIHDRLAATIAELSEGGPGTSSQQLCRDADDLLGALADAVWEIVPTKQREFLLPIYNHRSKNPWCNRMTNRFLHLLCDEEAIPFWICRSTAHDANNAGTRLGGLLILLGKYETTESKYRGLSFKDVVDSLLLVCEFFCKCFDLNLRTQATKAINCYLGTREHGEAHRLLIEKLDALAANESSKSEWIRDELLTQRKYFGEEIHITPLVELLIKATGNDSPFEMLAEDIVVKKILSGCSTI